MKCQRCKEKEAVGIINKKHYCDACCWRVKKELKVKRRENE